MNKFMRVFINEFAFRVSLQSTTDKVIPNIRLPQKYCQPTEMFAYKNIPHQNSLKFPQLSPGDLLTLISLDIE